MVIEPPHTAVKHLILGTAGHIDHGKTSLVRALTGVDTDRLPEEKSRGITIELGFAGMRLPGGIHLGVVDVPGHERFVRTMVAGAGGMDMIMLVIAADEGVMPQTREHLDICRLLGVKRGIVALTKSDLVPPDWLALVTDEVREFVAGSFLEDAPIVPVSARSGNGVENLKDVLLRLSALVEQKRNDRPFRLPVDRVFTVPGFGTVVTGTMLSGQVRVGDEVELLPGGNCARIRGIQNHADKVETGLAGQRLALNLQGLDINQVQRGDVATPRGLYRTTMTADVEVLCLKSAPRPLKHRSNVHLHSATFEVAVQVILFDRDRLEPGESAFARLRLAAPVLLLNGDSFVLRSRSPSLTVGGGTILDPAPPRRRRRAAETTGLLESMIIGDEQGTVEQLVSASLLTGISFPELLLRCGISAKRMDAVLAPLLSSGRIFQMTRDPRLFLSRESFHALCGILLNRLETYLARHSIKDGISREELKSCIPGRSDQRYFGPCLQYLEGEKKVIADRDLVRLPGRADEGGSDNAAVQLRLEQMVAQGGVEPPTLKELSEALCLPEKTAFEHLTHLARQGRLIRISHELFYAPVPLQTLSDAMMTHLRAAGGITPAEFREISGLSRKFMIPVLEYFDSLKMTIRVGDKRLLRRKEETALSK